MMDLNFPRFDFRFKSRENKRLVFDIIRKKYVLVLPEEWVRQHCIHYLIKALGYPAGRILVEREIQVAGLKKRLDVAVCRPDGSILILVECKAPEVAITQQTFDQIARYNLKADAAYLMVTNGLEHFYCELDHQNKSYRFLRELPPANPAPR